jgi:hypothetical protein
MVRLLLFAVIVAIAFIIWIVKAIVGTATQSDRLRQETFQSQTQKTMRSTARGVNWLNEQWEDAKRAAQGDVDDPTVPIQPDALSHLPMAAKTKPGYSNMRTDSILPDGYWFEVMRVEDRWCWTVCLRRGGKYEMMNLMCYKPSPYTDTYHPTRVSAEQEASEYIRAKGLRKGQEMTVQGVDSITIT